PPTQNPVTPEPGTTTGWGFETDPFAEGWTIRDDDGDGYNWEWMDASASDYNVYEGTHCMASASYQNSAFGGGTALTPNNWLISPAFTAGSTVTFWYAGQDPSYAAETFGVYVIANGTTSDELAYFTASGTYQQGSVDISDFAGQTVQVAFRHYDITDMFRLNLDLVEVSGGGSIPNTPVPPTDAPITDAPITDAPITDAPITDAPITEAPITEAPITDEPVTPAPGDVIFSVGGVHYVAAGSQVSVDLTIDGEYEANGMNIWVQYDAEKLTLNSVDEGEIMKAIKDLGGMNILDFQSIPGSVRLGSMLPTDPVSGSGKIFTMNFTVAEGLEDGTEMPIEILVKEFFNMPVGGENTPIAFFAENGSIVVGEAPVTEAPITDEPTAVPTDAPNPPITGAMSLIGVGIAAIVASAGVVIFRKKEED
ncbi:MAG: choice-of-anchor J domain-containing protein, partial [Clostridium sp.]|nr:choice-of-anchor J domain-containing protein [Clostridium sp.]